MAHVWRHSGEQRFQVKVAVSLAVLLCIALHCIGCGGGQQCYSPNPDDPYEPTQHVVWKNAYICSSPVQDLRDSECCTEGGGGDAVMSLSRACEVCQPGSPGCTDMHLMPGVWTTETVAIPASGYSEASCESSLNVPAGHTMYVCHFMAPGCYSPSCYGRPNSSFVPAMLTNSTVHGCSHRWTEWRGMKCPEFCEGRPYTVEGKALLATPLDDDKTPPGPSFESADAVPIKTPQRMLADNWGTGMSDIGKDYAHPLVARLVMEARGHGGGAQVRRSDLLSGTLALESSGQLHALLESAIVELEFAPFEERTKWHHSGLAEHASIGSFAKLCLELLVVGAPPRLLRRAIQAQEEELLHAHIALTLGSSRRDMGAGNGSGSSQSTAPGYRLAFPGHTLQLTQDTSAMRTAAITEGLEGEGRSALSLLRLGREPADGDARPAMRQLAWSMGLDEARHAALAAEFLEWLASVGGPAPPQVVLQDGSVSVSHEVSSGA